MGRKRRKRKNKKSSSSGSLPAGLTIDRARQSGHYQGTSYSEVYRDGKVYVYTAWNDNDDEVGKVMDFNAWVSSFKK